MGIEHFLKISGLNIQENYNLEGLKGSTAVVDVSGWIHRAREPATILPTCMGLASLLVKNGIRIIFVFDGKEPDSKSEVIAVRQRQRADKQMIGEELMKSGKPKEAKKAFAQCIQRTGTITSQLKNACKVSGMEYIVSPAEADAQMAYMIKAKKADLVVTEDADMIVYECPKILFKLKQNGTGDLYEQERVRLSVRAPFDLPSIRSMAIAIGTDYFYKGVHGIGVKRAMKLYDSHAPNLGMEQIRNYALTTTGCKLPLNFEQRFKTAEKTFEHQLVYDVDAEKIIPLSPYPGGLSQKDFPYAGQAVLTDVEHWKPANKVIGTWNLELLSLPDIFRCGYCPEIFASANERDAHKKIEHPTKCLVCGKILPGQAELKRHELSHSTKRTFSCSECDATFKHANSLKSHHNDVHSNKKLFICEICEKGFAQAYKLRNHLVTTHSDERPHECEKCQKRFKLKKHLTSHQLLHQTKKRFVCETCFKGFNTRRDFDSHKTVHKNEKLFSCNVCDKRFNLKQHLKQHYKVVHSRTEARYVCEDCGKVYKNASYLKEHKNIHKGLFPYRCSECPAKFSTGSALACHKSRHHKKNK